MYISMTFAIFFFFFFFLYVKVKLDFYVVDENTKDVNHQLHK